MAGGKIKFCRAHVLRTLGGLTLLGFSLGSCGSGGKAPVVPPGPEDPKLQPAVLPAYATLDVMSERNLARRLAMELNDSLNFAAIEAAIVSGGSHAGIDVAVASNRYVPAVSAFVGRAFGVESGALDDLDVIAATDPAVAASLTNQLRYEIAAEPALKLANLVGGSSSAFSDLFLGNTTVMAADAATFWGLAGAPLTYNDGRPALGILTSQAFLASASILGGGIDYPGMRLGAHVLERLRCVSLNRRGAHDFSSLDGGSVSPAGLAALHDSSNTCASCHAGMKAAGNALLGLGNPGGISNYKTFDGSDGAAWPEHWFGSSVVGWSSLSSALAADEGVQSCLTQRIFEATSQRPATYGRDIPRMAQIAATLSASGFKLGDWLKSIFQSPAVTSGPTLTTSKVSQLEGLVAKSRWMEPRKMLSALAEYAPLAAADLTGMGLGLDPAEFPGAKNSGRLVLPLGYAEQIVGLSGSAAVAIVAREFAGGVAQSQRSMFSGVADSAALTAEFAETEAARIWAALTGAEASATRKGARGDAYDVAVAASTAGTAAGRAQDGLAAILMSILISPYFLAY